MGTIERADAERGVPDSARAAVFHRAGRPLALLLAYVLLLCAFYSGDANLSLFYLHRQDLPLLLTGLGLLAICCWRVAPRPAAWTADWRLALLIGTGLALISWAGHSWILSGYDLSRDEQMASFDAAVFANGSLAAPLPGMWRDHAPALNTMFMYAADPRAAWVSDYLPLNAALRALVGLVVAPAITGPLMTLLGALALWGCARRIWPDSRETAVVALLLYAGSAQVVVTGMTAYAMPAHLALNLCWLWLFLRRRRWADMAALAVGFAAVGLHQPIMHPMFAAPVLFLLLLEKDWRRAALYFVGYAAIGLFWLWWPHWISTLVQVDGAMQQVRDSGYAVRLMNALAAGDGMRMANMIANLARFAAWNHLLLIPLLIAGFLAARRDRLAGALAGGLILTLVTMTVILPYQGHGFGYRYLHGQIGNCILLAVFGWQAIGAETGRWRTLLRRTTCAGALILLPLQLWFAHGFYAPAAAASARIDRSGTDYAVIGESDVPFSADLVINPPRLDGRPIRLLRGGLNPELVGMLCARWSTVAMVEPTLLKPVVDYYGFGKLPDAEEASRDAAARLRVAGCTVTHLR